MSSFDYLKTAIKQQGCTLQQVADASGMTKGYLSQLLNAKIKSPSAQKLEALHRYLGLEFPRQKKTIGVVFGKFYPLHTGHIYLIQRACSGLTSCISLWVLTIPATAHCSKTAPCRSSPRCRIVCAGYCKPLNIRKISVFMLSMKRAWSHIHTAGMYGATASKVYG